eukprot:SAG22_NODE_8337_length_663_cov_0.923759_2_plen_24_part_01
MSDGGRASPPGQLAVPGGAIGRAG